MRLRVLPLPTQVVGDVTETPFALVIDGWGSSQMGPWVDFRDRCGARAILVSDQRIDLDDSALEVDQLIVERIAAAVA